MNIPRPLRSPLLGTILVLVLMAGLAVPLVQLTWRRAARTAEEPTLQSGPVESMMETNGVISAVVRLKLLSQAKTCRLRNASGSLLLDLHDLPAGESEHDVTLPWSGGEMEITAEADFSELVGETAVFVTVMPDGHEDQTAFATGTSPIREILRFRWENAR